MKIGDYCRTKDGKIFKWNILCKIKQEWSEEFINEYTRFCYIDKNDIIKSSPNIIDLIEVGDYVNGERVICKQYKEYPNPLLDHYVIDTIRCSYKENEIKSIVTKEEFEDISYKVGD